MKPHRPRNPDKPGHPRHPRAPRIPHVKPVKKEPTTDWGQVAKWYDQLVGESGSEYQREVVLPGVVRLLGLRPGESALDVACGQGVLCRILHKQGVRATGVDAARELIGLARERSDPAVCYF